MRDGFIVVRIDGGVTWYYEGAINGRKACMVDTFRIRTIKVYKTKARAEKTVAAIGFGWKVVPYRD